MDENTKIRNLFALSLTAILIGAIVVFCGLTIAGGGVQSALGLFLISVVCTLGLSLVIWLPLFWLVGMLILGVFMGSFRLMGWGLDKTFPGAALWQTAIVDRAHAERSSLANYIRKAQAKGLSQSQIETRLRQEGWTAIDIEQAYALMEINTQNS